MIVASPRRPARTAIRPAGAAVANAAVFRRLPKRDERGRLEWIHWADLELASAWGRLAVRLFDELVATYGSDAVRAEWFDGNGAFFRAALTALESFVKGCQALNTSPLLSVQLDDGRREDLVRSTLVARNGAIEVKTSVQFRSSQGASAAASQQAAFERIGAPTLEHNQSIVWDVLSNAIVSRGDFEHGMAFLRNAPPERRWRLSWRGRRPWYVFGYSADDEWAGREYVDHIAIALVRAEWLELVRAARAKADALARTPWTFLANHRSVIDDHNERVARQWGLSQALPFPGRDPKDVRAFLAMVQRLTEARSLAEFERSRERFIADMRAAGQTAGALSRVAGEVAAFFTEITGFMLRVLPREWFATAETFVPLPVPYMLAGDESPQGEPTIAVPAPPDFVRRNQAFADAPSPIDSKLEVVTTMVAELTPMRDAPPAVASRSESLSPMSPELRPGSTSRLELYELVPVTRDAADSPASSAAEASVGPPREPSPPVVVSDDVGAEERIAMLDRIADASMRNDLVREFAALVPKASTERARAEALLAYVHAAFRYRPDPPGVEVFQSALETIANGGDCEDLAALFVALARLLGLRARLVWLDQQIHGSALNHVFAQVLIEGRWVDAEASIAGAELGEAPAQAARRLRS